MAKREIGTKIKLDGEAQFKASVSAINQNLAVLSSEMGAATSAFDKNNMSMSDLQKKSEIYGRQIEAQKQKLEVYNKALTEAEKLKIQNAEAAERVAKEYGEESEEAQKARAALEQSVKIYNDYQIKVNNTVKSINQLEKAQKDTDKAAEELSKGLKDVSNDVDKAEKSVDEFSDEIRNAGENVLTFGDLLKSNIAGDFIADGLRSATDTAKEFAVQSIELAGTAQKAQEAVDATFGNSADTIEKWAAASANNFGISATAAKQYTTDLGGLIKSFEVTADKAADMSVNMVGLAGDLASFHQRDLQEAFDKIRAGIEGDVEQLKDFGINMSEAKLEAYAFSQGIKTAYSEMSEAEQVQLRYNYLMQATSDIQGNFTRTSKDTANQQQILKANIENMSVSLGEKLLPSVNNVLAIVNDKLPSIEPKLETIGTLIGNITEFALENADAIMGMTAGYAAFAGANAIGNGIMTVVNSVKALKTANDAATVSQNVMNAAANANPYVLLASAIAAVTVGLVTYANTADTAHNRLKDIKNEIENLNQATEDSIKTTESEIAVLESKAEKYEELRVKANRTAGEEQQLIELAKELQAYMPEGTFLINEQTGAYNSLAGSISNVTEAMRVNAYISAYKEEYEGLTKQLIEAEKEFEELDKKVRVKNEDGTYDPSLNIFNQVAWKNAKDTITETKDRIAEIEGTLSGLYETSAELSKQTTETVSSSTSAMAGYYEKQGKAALSAVETIEDYETATQAALDEIEHRYKTHQLTEKEYYAEMERYLKSHANAESELYWEMSDKVNNYYKQKADQSKKAEEQVAKNSQKACEAEIKAQEKTTEALKKETEEKMEILKKGLNSQIVEYEKKLTAIQEQANGFANKVKMSFKDAFTFEVDENNNITKAFTTNKIVESNKQLEQYLKLIERLKERGVSSGLLSQLTDFSVEEGIKAAEYYATLSDQQLKNLENNWNKYNKTASALSDEFYSEQMKSTADSMINSLNAAVSSNEETLKSMGINITKMLAEGMISETSINKIKAVCDELIKNFKINLGTEDMTQGMYSIANAKVDYKSGGNNHVNNRDLGNVYLTVNSSQPLSPTEVARQTRNSLTLAGLS